MPVGALRWWQPVGRRVEEVKTNGEHEWNDNE